MKSLTLIAGLVILLFAGSSFAQQMTGSEHDFSGNSWNNTGEICVVCHTPHNAKANVTPLWNHEVTASNFTPYSSTTMDAVAGQPDGAAKLCLSCHDGSVALDNFGSRTNGGQFLTGDDKLGTDLTNDHPVSITYDAALASADGGLHDPTTDLSGLGGTIAADMLESNKIQCSSCHDVHNGSGLDKLLVKSNAGSALCLTCHAK